MEMNPRPGLPLLLLKPSYDQGPLSLMPERQGTIDTM